jgi:polyisoprenoid-binding protein YceI
MQVLSRSKFFAFSFAIAGVAAILPPANAAHAAEFQAFEIVSKKSEVRFVLDELLFGKPKRVVGWTSKVEGAVGLDMSGGAAPKWIPIRVDASSLSTDNGFRNKVMRNQILQANQKEFRYIVFKPTAVENLPDPRAVTVGEPFFFRVTGDLTIRGLTQAVTFDVEVTAKSARELIGTGSAVISRAAYNLQIPKLHDVAEVSDEVALEIDFVMKAVGGE